MIMTIRNQFKQSTVRYIAIMIVVALSVGMVSIPSLLRQAGDAWAVQVNGKKVSYREFAQEVAEQSEFLAQIRAQYGQYADLLMQAMNWPTDPKALAFDVLVKIALLNQFVDAIGIHIHSQYIAESINDAQFARQHLQRILPQFLFDTTGGINAEKLKMFLHHKGMSIRDFEHKIEQSIAQLQAMQFVASTCYVPLFDIEQEFVAQNLGKDFSYLMFSLDSFLAIEKKKNISDEDVFDFYNKENNQRRRYWVPEKRDGIVWKFDAKSYNTSISEEQMNQYYEDNKISKYILDPVKIHVQQISEKQLAQHPAMTLEMIKEDIQKNPASAWAQKWESVEPFARGEKKGAFEKEAFLLQNAGDISSVIETKDGKVIVQLIKRIPRTYKPFNSVKNEIKNILMEKQFKKNFVKDLKDVAIKGDSQAIESFIAQKGGKKEMAVGVSKNDTVLSQELFGLKKGEYAFFVENETGFAVQLANIAERHLPEFNSIKTVVKGDLCEERAYDAMIHAVQEAKDATADSSFEAIAKKYNVPLQYTGMILPGDNKKMQELEKKGLPARTMLELNKEGLVLLHNNDRTSFLIKVDAIEEYSEGDLLAAEKEIKSHLTSHRMKAQVESTIASLHRNATIETNETTVIAGEEYSE
ncbi:MAG TPA: SurA N-terminal domain-containing protein [Candidatus Babeliales bacterium]|nr:SurA N-terminal domain-containing protein [Candidatus Babeliales bacterium]